MDFKDLLANIGNAPGTRDLREEILPPDFPSGKQGLPLHFIGFLPKGRGVQMLGVKTISVYKSA